MLIVCPHCASSYDVDEAALGARGRPVRCGVCRSLWFAASSETPEIAPSVAPRPAKAARRSFKQRFDAMARAGSIMAMIGFGAFTGFTMSGEWPRWLIPLARSFGLEKPLWPELDGVVAKLEKTPEGATVISIEGEWIGAVRAVAAPIVEFAVRNSANEEVARWTDRSGPSKLAPGETAPFRSRFAVPGGDAREVRARYVGFTPERAPSH